MGAEGDLIQTEDRTEIPGMLRMCMPSCSFEAL
jgi:hypothetical protein